MNELIHTPSPIDIAGDGIAHEDDEEYKIYSKIHILNILQKIMNKNTQVALHFDKSNRLILTSILEINTETDEIIIDYGAKPELNALALKAKCLNFISSLDKIKIKFTCHKIKTTLFEDRDVFSVNLPESLIRLQRRKNYRLTLPITHPLKCIIPISTEEKTFKAELNLIDICCGGISVTENRIPIDLKLGTNYEDCQIHLPGVGYITVTIKIMGFYEQKLKNGQQHKRIRCQFVNLPARIESMIQRYIIQQDQSKLT